MEWLDSRTPGFLALLHFGSVAVLAIGDYVTGADIAFTALYLVPIASAAWFGTSRHALSVATFCSVAWLATQWLTEDTRPLLAIVAWNFIVELVTFLAAAVLVHNLRLALVEERRALVAAHEKTLATQKQLQHAERLSTVGRLAAGVAHELGTPLNVVSTYAQMIETRTITDGEVPDTARIIREQSGSMTRIIRQLVDFARAGKPQRNLQSANDLLQASASLLRPIAHKKQVTVTIEDTETRLVDADTGQMQQVLANLIVNAVHAVDEKGHVWARVGRSTQAPPDGVAAPPNGWVVFEIDDDGCGLSPDVAQHLFEPFFTTKGVGEGTGLGLAVAHGMIREHGGFITAANRSEGGARFTVLLPALSAP
jgi:two-component system NtrC family sensor kinase